MEMKRANTTEPSYSTAEIMQRTLQQSHVLAAERDQRRKGKKEKEKSLEALGSYSSKKLQKTDKTQKSRTQFKQFKSESQETKHNSILVVGSSRPHFTFFSK